LKAGIKKYGVLVFRETGMTDEQHVEFSRPFGELDRPPNVRSKTGRLTTPELFDLSNCKPNGELATKDDVEYKFYKSNILWHADMLYHPRRALYSILRAHEIPPKGKGGATQFLDTRTAYEDMPLELKNKLDGKIANNSFLYNRRIAAPELYVNEDPNDWPLARWPAVIPHQGTGRINMNLTLYCYKFDGMSVEDSAQLVKEVFDFVDQEKYITTVDWDQVGDVVMWDNTAVLHRATIGEYEGIMRRDMRRTTVNDSGPFAWGGPNGNDPGNNWKLKLPEPYRTKEQVLAQ